MESSIYSSRLIQNDPNVHIRNPGSDLDPTQELLDQCPYMVENFFNRPLPDNDR
ncbi:hypothetical protein BJ944DRAFT_171263, partial [Cunninghamella echinulata]